MEHKEYNRIAKLSVKLVAVEAVLRGDSWVGPPGVDWEERCKVLRAVAKQLRRDLDTTMMGLMTEGRTKHLEFQNPDRELT